jgi:iron complex outermembrane recepter protein
MEATEIKGNTMKNEFIKKNGYKVLLTALLMSTASSALAQGAVQTITDEVIVTATKKAGGENVQDVAIAMTAYGSDQLDALQVRDIAGLSFKMPNVSLDDIGTARGTANFSIRGLGVNSSIPSIDPAVGVFVDGMYLGVNGGVIFDTFDLESIEVLRGPQGVLFGKNVTGGAVIINTADPSFDFGVKAKFAVESGLRDTGANYYAMGSVTGPIMGDKLAGKLAVYYNNDEGWFKNGFDGSNIGKADTFILRPSFKFAPSDRTEIVAKFEYGETGGDGPVGQSHTNGSGLDGQIVNFDRNSFDASIDERGTTDATWYNAIVEANFDVDFGDGTVTNIFAWRKYNQSGISDIDSTPASLFHASFATDQDQISNELRYAGTFDKVDLTTGLFYFQQNLGYDEVRNLLGALTPSGAPALTQHGGGIQDHETIGAFANIDYNVNDRIALTAGVRYTDESKDVLITSLFRNINSPCSVIGGTCVPDFPGTNDNGNFKSSNWSPTVGVKFVPSDDAQFYANWKRAFRAGGYNFRNTSPAGSPGPFRDEQVDTIEIGMKKDWPGLARLNAAVYRTRVKDMQREINLPSGAAGVVQLIRNTADAEILGFELEGQLIVSDNFLIDGSLGIQDGTYQTVLFDISGDGIVNDADLALDIPRLAPVTANIGFIYDHDLGNLGMLTARASYSYRAESAYTDNNRGILNAGNRVDASIALAMNDQMRLSLYGKNLTNNVQHGNDTQLPSLLGPIPLGGTFAPLSKGRVVGIELQIDY